LTLLITERVFEVFRASSAVSIDSAFCHPSQTFSLLRNHLPPIVQSPPHTSSIRHFRPFSDITLRIHSHLNPPRRATVASASGQPGCLSCSNLAVSLDFVGFLCAMLAGLLRPATRYGVDGVSELQPPVHRLRTEVPNRWMASRAHSQPPHTLRRIPLDQSRTASPRPNAPPDVDSHPHCAPRHAVTVVGASIEPAPLTEMNAAPTPWWLSATRFPSPQPAAQLFPADQLRRSRDDSPASFLTIRCRKSVSTFA